MKKQSAHMRRLETLSPKEYAERQMKQFVRMRRLEAIYDVEAKAHMGNNLRENVDRRVLF